MNQNIFKTKNYASLAKFYVYIVLYYLTIFICSRNLPFGDDYYLLKFVNTIIKTSDYEKIINHLFSLHNEHRIVTTRLLFLLDYDLFGNINFIRINLLENLFQLITFFIYLNFLIYKNKIFLIKSKKIYYQLLQFYFLVSVLQKRHFQRWPPYRII